MQCIRAAVRVRSSACAHVCAHKSTCLYTSDTRAPARVRTCSRTLNKYAPHRVRALWSCRLLPFGTSSGIKVSGVLVPGLPWHLSSSRVLGSLSLAFHGIFLSSRVLGSLSLAFHGVFLSSRVLRSLSLAVHFFFFFNLRINKVAYIT